MASDPQDGKAEKGFVSAWFASLSLLFLMVMMMMIDLNSGRRTHSELAEAEVETRVASIEALKVNQTS